MQSYLLLNVLYALINDVCACVRACVCVCARALSTCVHEFSCVRKTEKETEADRCTRFIQANHIKYTSSVHLRT